MKIPDRLRNAGTSLHSAGQKLNKILRKNADGQDSGNGIESAQSGRWSVKKRREVRVGIHCINFCFGFRRNNASVVINKDNVSIG